MLKNKITGNPNKLSVLLSWVPGHMKVREGTEKKKTTGGFTVLKDILGQWPRGSRQADWRRDTSKG